MNYTKYTFYFFYSLFPSILVDSVVDVIKYLLSVGMVRIFTNQFCQDPLATTGAWGEDLKTILSMRLGITALFFIIKQ